jgi:hypothetical protein
VSVSNWLIESLFDSCPKRIGECCHLVVVQFHGGATSYPSVHSNGEHNPCTSGLALNFPLQPSAHREASWPHVSQITKSEHQTSHSRTSPIPHKSPPILPKWRPRDHKPQRYPANRRHPPPLRKQYQPRPQFEHQTRTRARPRSR